MRSTIRATLACGVIVSALAMASVPVFAQGTEEFPGPDAEAPLAGYTRTDGTVVLTDDSFCRFLLGSVWGDQQLTFAGLIDGSKKQKRARAAAFSPAADDATVGACVEVLTASRTEPPADDTIVAWARRSPVVPEVFAGLLTEDWEARPLAQPDEIGPAARTSGFGDVISAPFEMDARTWLAEVDAKACPEWSGSLVNARDTSDRTELGGVRQYLYDHAPGHYYWDVSAGDCEWSVDLVPVELGPDPTATPDARVVVPALHGTDYRRHYETYLTATEARAALLEAGLTVGQCTEEMDNLGGGVEAGRVWGQEPIAGTLLEPGSAVDVWMVSDCDVLRGDRIILE